MIFLDPFYLNILSMPQVFEQSLFLFFFRPINDHTKTAAANRRNDIFLLLSPASWNGERTELSECTLDWRQNEVRTQVLLMAVDNCMRRLRVSNMKRTEKQRDTRTETVFKVPRMWIKYRCIVTTILCWFTSIGLIVLNWNPSPVSQRNKG